MTYTFFGVPVVIDARAAKGWPKPVGVRFVPSTAELVGEAYGELRVHDEEDLRRFKRFVRVFFRDSGRLS